MTAQIYNIRDYQKAKVIPLDPKALSQLAIDVMKAALDDTAPSEMIPYHVECSPDFGVLSPPKKPA